MYNIVDTGIGYVANKFWILLFCARSVHGSSDDLVQDGRKWSVLGADTNCG